MVMFGLEKRELVLNHFLKGEDIIIFSLGMISKITYAGQGRYVKNSLMFILHCLKIC